MQELSDLAADRIGLILLKIGLKDPELLFVCDGERDEGREERVLNAPLEMT